MHSLWNDREAEACAGDDLALRVYTSRLLGSDEYLVMHGGGNTSVKAVVQDFLGRDVEVLYVKGSGWDLKTIEKPGFPALRLDETKRLADLKALSDEEMTRQLRSFMLDPSAPSPSVEAILHAIVPAKFVDHTHADAMVTLTNNPQGEAIMQDICSDCLILPYVMPGFILAKQVHEAIRDIDIDRYKGIILMHHGVFTWSDDARVAYENMIELVSRAEAYIADHGQTKHPETQRDVNLPDLARIRRAVSDARGSAQLAMLDRSASAQGYASRKDIADIATRGPITPDHVIRTKRIPAIVAKRPEEDVPEVAEFSRAYAAYYEAHKTEGLQMLDPAPRMAVWEENGCIAFGSSVRECVIVTDIAHHTRQAIQTGESLGGWQALSEQEIFDLEYWSLEQAKLGKKRGIEKEHQGKIAIVTGACSGIGKAACEALAREGATVAGIDINPGVVDALEGMTGIVCDVTDDNAVQAAVDHVVAAFGGLDIIVCNAGIFRSGERIEEQDDAAWNRMLAVNLTATQRFMKIAIPYLKLGIRPSIIVVGSRNYAAPGPGAAAYSVSKAGITQLARVAALELAADGVRVNVVHPDAVFDTELWTDEALKRSARRYNMTVEEYKTKNLLKTEIRSADVGRLISVMAGDVFRATTGAQVPIDGGVDRVI